MNFVKSNEGQLCNRIWSYVSIIAYSEFYNKKLAILDFDEYIDLFPNLKSNKSIKIFPYKKYRKIFNKCFKFLKRLNFIRDFDYKHEPVGLSLVIGWDYRFDNHYFNSDNVSKIKWLFEPALNIQQKCNDIITHEKSKIGILVGVHIRLGDYREFENGKFYFSNEQYLTFMKRMESLLDVPVSFLLCSNEFIDIEDFFGVNCFKIPKASAIEDLHALSLCDYIIGPPSTYTIWASFYGGKLLHLIDNAEYLFDLNDFKISVK